MKKTKLMAALTASAMALSMAVPFNVSALAEPPAVELYETYTLKDFIELDEDTVTSIRQELAPDVDAAAECEAVKAAGEAAIANDEVIISGYLPHDVYQVDVWGGFITPADVFSLDLSGIKDSFTYALEEFDGSEYVEFEVEFTGEFTADDIYRVYVWLTAQPEAVNITVEDTSYTACGLTKEELYEKYDYYGIMNLTPEEICSFSKEIKDQYESLVNEIGYFGFTGYYTLNLKDEYKADIPFYTDPVAARRTIIKDSGIREEVCWGLITPEYSGVTSVQLWFYSDMVTYYADLYDLERSDFAARLWVYLSLNPNVNSVSGGVVSTAPTGWFPSVVYNNGFDYVIENDIKGIFNNLPTYMPLCYVDGLEYLEEHSNDKYKDLWRYSMILDMEAPEECFTDGAFTDQSPLLERLHITEDWLQDGTVAYLKNASIDYHYFHEAYRITFDKEFLEGYLAQGYEDAHLFASLFTWFEANDWVEDIYVTADAEAALYKEYTFDEFLAFSEEDVISIHQQLAPDIDAAAECEAIKAAGALGMENGDVNLLIDMSMKAHMDLVLMGGNTPDELFAINCYSLHNDISPTYRTTDYDGETYMEYRFDVRESGFDQNSLDPADAVYKMYVWLLADSEAKAVRVEDTSFTSCGLTEDEIFAKYTFDDIMKLTPEEICTFSKEIKDSYLALAPTIDYLGFVNNIIVTFTSDYTDKIKTNDDLVAAREETGEMLRLPDELYWGIKPSFNTSISAYTNLVLHEENVEAMAESYGLTVGDFIARVNAWMDLNPNVTNTYGGFYPEGAAGAINPDILYDDNYFSIDEIAAGSPEEIYTLPFYSAQHFIDALVYARDNGIDSVDDMYKQRFRILVNNRDNCFNNDGTLNMDLLKEALHIDESWLRNGFTDDIIWEDESRPKYRWMYIDIDEEFYDSLISSGCKYTDTFAAVYTWLESNNNISEVIIEENTGYTEPEVKYGEVNRDGQVSLLDVVALCKYNAGAVTLNASQLKAADCTGDGVINSSDVTALQMFIVEKISVLPVIA